MRYSVFTINYLDITNQGIKDAVVMTGRGIHILKVSYFFYHFLMTNHLKFATIVHCKLLKYNYKGTIMNRDQNINY